MRILLTGASGQLGAYLIEHLKTTPHEIIAWSGTERGHRSGQPLVPIDLTDGEQLRQSLDSVQPDAIIHGAAISAADAVRLDPVRAISINVQSTQRISDWAARNQRRLVFTSTDLVFDGLRAWNRETDPARPSLAYGQTKLDAEAAVLAIPSGVVARICLLFGPSKCGRPYFFDRAIDAIRCSQTQTFFEDEFRTPLHLGTAAQILNRLVESDVVGIYHVAGQDRVSRFDLMRRAVQAMGLDARLVKAGRRADVPLQESRPADVSLDSLKLAEAFPDLVRPTIEEALNRSMQSGGTLNR